MRSAKLSSLLILVAPVLSCAPARATTSATTEQLTAFQPAADTSGERSAGSFIFDRIDEEQGLPAPDVRDIVQDRQGFLWLGVFSDSRGGLVRYDPYGVKLYREAEDEKSLASNSVWLVEIDDNDVMWVATTRAGLHRYNAETDDFTRFVHDPEDPTSVPSDGVKSMVHASDGTLWFGTAHGLARFEPETETFSSYLFDPDTPGGLPDRNVRSMVEDPETGRLWLGTRRGGLSIFDPVTETFTNYANDPYDPTSLSNDSVDVIVRDADGTFWLATREGLNRYNPETDDFTRYYNDPSDPTSLGHSKLWSMEADSQGRLWVGHEFGLDLFDRESGTAVHIVNRPDDATSLGSGPVRSIYEDQTGAIWISTRTGGLSRLSARPPNISTLRHDPYNPTSISADEVTQIATEENGVAITTPAGVDVFDGRTFTHYSHDPDQPDAWPKNVTGVLPEKDGDLWMGSAGGLLTLYEPDTGTLSRIQAPPPAESEWIAPRVVTPEGDLWYSVQGHGLFKLSDGRFTALVGDTVDTDSDEQVYLYTKDVIHDVERSVLWVAGAGLARVDLETDDVSVFLLDPSQPFNAENQLFGIRQAADGNLWMAGNAGLHLFDTETGSYAELYAEQFPVKQLKGLEIDDSGTVWTVSGSTLVAFDPGTESATGYDTIEGFPDNIIFNHLSMGPEGRIYVMSQSEGLVSFDPKNMVANPEAPPVALTGLELFGDPVSVGDESGLIDKPLGLVERLDLDHDQNHLTFAFTALSYEEPEKNRFAYQLDGFDGEWRTATPDRRFATYTNLPAGDYTFRVRAANNSGVWNDEGLSVPVTISPPWWANTIAYLIYAVIGLAALFGFDRWRTNTISKRNKALEVQLEERRKSQLEKAALFEQAREQATKIQSLMDATPTGIVLLGSDQELVTANHVAERDLHTVVEVDGDNKVKRIGGLPIDQLVTPDNGDRWFDTTAGEGESTRYITATARPTDPSIADSSDWVVLWDDVTEQRKLQQQTARQERMAVLGRFAAGVAHDLNNVLTVIKLSALLLQKEPDLTSSGERWAGQIEEQTDRADKFVSQILDYIRQNVVQRQPLDLASLVEHQIDGLKEVWPEDARLIFEAGGDVTTTFADPARIDQAVLNLVTNARDAIGDSGHVSVKVDTVHRTDSDELVPAGEWARITVTDDGHGIEADRLEEIFEPFTTSKRTGKGTGLGLAQVEGIVRQHDGYVSVESEVGVGSTFQVYLPLDRSATAVDLQSEVAPRKGPRGQGQSILVVEDDPDVNAAMCEMLVESGYRVSGAADGRDVLNRWNDIGTSLDLVITDLLMSDVTGYELVEHLLGFDDKLPIIIVSGVADSGPNRVAQDRVQAFLRKPIDEDLLLSEIANALR